MLEDLFRREGLTVYLWLVSNLLYRPSLPLVCRDDLTTGASLGYHVQCESAFRGTDEKDKSVPQSGHWPNSASLIGPKLMAPFDVFIPVMFEIMKSRPVVCL